MKRNAVILVDHRTRDLMVAVLLARQLEERGVQCHLEPLESYHGCLAAYAPDLILFNHINSGHLVRYSHRLAKLGVLTAVLPNEGILYDEEVLRYNSGKYHQGAHIDYFFCWNALHRDALLAAGLAGQPTRVEVCGVPRFDFYFEPWARVFNLPPQPAGRRPRLLCCTNFGFAFYADKAPAVAERLFAPWKERVSLMRDPAAIIELQARERVRALDHLRQLAECGEFDLTLRPHPREDSAFYAQFLASLTPAAQTRVRLDATSNITELILACDLEISCETCTTALESWIADKPTVELTFERHPLFFHAETAQHNVLCDKPADLVGLVCQQLQPGAQAALAAGRRQHLAKWCASPAGDAAGRVAAVLAEAVHARPAPARQFTLGERRKGAKLKLLRRANLPYHFDPLLALKRRLLPRRYTAKSFTLDKAIRPSDVAADRRQLTAALAAP